MPLRARVPLGCSYAKFDERGFSGSNELGLRREITFLVEKERRGEKKKQLGEGIEVRVFSAVYISPTTIMNNNRLQREYWGMNKAVN